MRNSNLAKFRAEKELSTMDIAKIIGVSTSFYEKQSMVKESPVIILLLNLKMRFQNRI